MGLWVMRAITSVPHDRWPLPEGHLTMCSEQLQPRVISATAIATGPALADSRLRQGLGCNLSCHSLELEILSLKLSPTGLHECGLVITPLLRRFFLQSRTVPVSGYVGHASCSLLRAGA